MAFRQSAAYKFLLMFMSLACLAVAGYFVWQALKPTASLEEIYKQAEASYNQGDEAYKGGNFTLAADKFDTARKLAEQVLGSIQKQREQAAAAGKELAKKDEVETLEAKAHYLRARAIRDKYHAQAAIDGKPIPDLLDTSTGEKYRSFTAITDPKDQDQAFSSMFHAALVLNKEPAILKDAVRLELTVPPIDWERFSKILNAVLELDPKDSRAHYWAARYDFFQPQKGDKGWEDADPSKRSVERVERSLRAVRKAKELGTQPPWRLIDLEARALEWLADIAPKKKSNQPNKPEEELRTLILHPNDGALATVRKAEKLDLPTTYDLQGVLTTYLISVRLAVRDAGKPGGDRKAVIVALRNFLDAVPKARASTHGKVVPEEITQGLLEALAIAQPLLSVGSNAEWSEIFDKYLAAAAETKEQNARRPALIALMTDLLGKEIRRSSERSDNEREKKLKKRQAELIGSALKEAETRKTSKAALDLLHAQALELQLLDGASAEEMALHLKALPPAPHPSRPAIASFAEGIIAWRQGKILKARDHLETSLRYRDSVDFIFGAQWLLYQIYSATGQMGLALNALRDTESYFAQPEKFTALDRLAVADAPIGPDDFPAHLAVANIEVARQNIIKHLKSNPDAAPPAELSAIADKMADAALKKLKTPSPADLYLRLARFRLRQAQQLRQPANEMIGSLRRDYADSIAVVAAEAMWLSMPRALTTATPKPTAEGIKEADALIEEFCAFRPRDVSAKLCRVEWLARTDRQEEALATLREPSNFDKEIGAELFRLLVHLRGYPIVGVAAFELQGYEPADGDLAATLVQAVADQHPSPSALTNPYRAAEARGRQALRAAAGELANGRFEDAARGFVETLSISALIGAVREGLWKTVRSCAAVDPIRARNLCADLVAERSDEPILYFGAAFAALLQRDIGYPRDSWDRGKSMMAALNRWEPIAKKSGGDAADLAMARAHFGIAAGRTTAANDDADRAYAYDDTNVSALVFLARRALRDNKEDGLKLAQKYWNTSVAMDPDDIEVRCLEIELKARRGELAAAVRAALGLIRDYPRSGRAYEVLVRIGAEKKDGDEVLGWARQWMKALPCEVAAVERTIPILIRRGKLDDAKTTTDDFLANCTMEMSRRLEELKPAASGIALENWQRYAKVVSNRVHGETWLGVIAGFREAGQSDVAEARLKAALDKNPDSEVLLMLHGELCAAASRWKDANEAYRRVLATNPRHAPAAAAAVRLTEQLMNADDAYRIIRAFGSPGDPDATPDPAVFPLDLLLAIGEVHEQFTALAQRSALRHIVVDSLQRFPNDPRVQLYAGQLHYAMGDGARAADCLQRAVRLARAEEGTELSRDERQKVGQAAQQALDRVREAPKTGNSDA